MTNKKKLVDLLKEITILYVEDNELTQEIIIDTLSLFSKNVIVASNGEEALAIFKKDDIQLIISDIEMPFMDGIKFISHIREINITVPVIMTSGHFQENYLYACANLNTQAYILKPISSVKLKDALYKVAQYLNVTSSILINITHSIQYNKNKAILIDNEKEHKLNNKEKLLLDLLIENKNKIVTYSQIEQLVWLSFDEVMTQSALRTVVKNLRKKSNSKFIENISGSGYLLKIDY